MIAMYRNRNSRIASDFAVNMMSALNAQKRLAISLKNLRKFFARNQFHIAISRILSVAPTSSFDKSTDRQPAIAP